MDVDAQTLEARVTMAEVEQLRILLIQTAFLGDVVLTLPLVQALKRAFPSAAIDVLVTPQAENVLSLHPDVSSVLSFDKKGSQRGIVQLFRLGTFLRSNRYDMVVTPHRSLRTAFLAVRTGARVRVGFDTSAAAFLYTKRVRYDPTLHEADRNLQLLTGLGVAPGPKERPYLKPSEGDRRIVDELLASHSLPERSLVGLAPGSVWFTKRWPAERYASLVVELERRGKTCVMIGGKEDEKLVSRILDEASPIRSFSAAGRLTIKQSAELIGRCSCLVTNDSAPLHLGVAMGTRVVAIFGPTVPSFGFGPYGVNDAVVQTVGLSCRPCTKHGGASCPITTFECMLAITPERVADEVVRNFPD